MNGSQGYAYPHGAGHVPYEHGLTKRELIATVAMQGLLARTNFSLMEEIAAQQAVRAADALIAELSK